MKKELDFGLDMRSFIKELEGFLSTLFQEKKCYAPHILKFLRVPPNIITNYQDLLEKAYLLESGIIDGATGVEIPQDRNAIYLSLNLYRFMWVDDHYEYYMRVAPREGGRISYPIKRIEVTLQPFRKSRNFNKCCAKW